MKFLLRLRWAQTLWANPSSRLGILILAAFVIMAVCAPWLGKGDPSDFMAMPNLPPSADYWFGTDNLGRDVFTRTIWGARTSLFIGFATAAIGIAIAITIGATAGFFRGWLDEALTLLTNLFLVLPGLPLLILLSAYLKPSSTTIIWTLAITGWAFHARIIRAQSLSLRERDFVLAARVSGEGNLSIIRRELLPNMINIVAGSFIGIVSYGISAETAMSFLGLTNVDDVSWGTNLYWAQTGGAMMAGAWWAVLAPGLCVALTIFALSLLNYGLDEITNPRLAAERQIRPILNQMPILRGVRATPVMPRIGQGNKS